MRVDCGSTKVALGSRRSRSLAETRRRGARLSWPGVRSCRRATIRRASTRFAAAPGAIARGRARRRPERRRRPDDVPRLPRPERGRRAREPERAQYAPAERWAEPLVQNFTRVLVEDLGNALGSDRVAASRPRRGHARLLDRGRGRAFRSRRRRQRPAHGALGHSRQRAEDPAHPPVAAQRQATVATVEGGVNALSAALGDWRTRWRQPCASCERGGARDQPPRTPLMAFSVSRFFWRPST